MADNRFVQIPVDVAKRIARATRYVEGIAGIEGAGEIAPQFSESGFYAKITAVDTTTKRCSWKRIYIKSTETSEEITDDDLMSGDKDDTTLYAVEISGCTPPIGAIVRMMPGLTGDFYLFEFQGKCHAQLQASLGYQSYCNAKLYDKPTTEAGHETLGSEIRKVYSSPLWNSGDSLDNATDVEIEWFACYGRWCVSNAECGET